VGKRFISISASRNSEESMLLQISTTASQATDLGFLLHKNPANRHKVDIALRIPTKPNR